MDNSLAHLMSWSEGTKGDVPPPLTGPSVTVSPLSLPAPPTVFVFGGKYVQTRRLTAEMWALDITTRVWSKVDAGEGPGPRYFHSMDAWEDKLVCFGGMSDSDPMSVHGDIWFFDCRARRWLPPLSPAAGIAQEEEMMPSARYAHLSAVSRGKLVVSGGQHADNSWIYEINIYDLRRRVWTSKTEQPELQGQHSKGAYRSVAISSRQRVITPSATDLKGSAAPSYSIDEDGEGGEIWCYSNYDFAKVRRELDIIAPSDLDTELVPSTKFASPPSFSIRDDSRLMRGSSQPPGLRFPTGGIIGNHLILCGLYLASTSAAFSVWALDLSTMAWRHIEPGVLSSGSWNRAVIWSSGAKLLCFGNNQHDLSSDYGRRAVNFEHMAVVSLETFGIYQPPILEIAPKIQEVGLSMLDEKLASDFDVICDDGRKVKCSRRLLAERWAWFAEEERKLARTAESLLESPALDINDTFLGTYTPARLTPTSLTIPEPLPVCIALVQYFYTLSLSTPLQNRAPVLSALLFLAKQYRIDRLRSLVVHALHCRLDPTVAVGVYEIASLSGEQNLQVRALGMVHSAKSGSGSRSHRQPPPGQSVQDAQSPPTGSATTIPTSGSVAGSSDTGAAAPIARVEEGNFRRARADSGTLPADEVERMQRLLEAIDMSDEVARPESPTEREIPRLISAPLPPPGRLIPPVPTASASSTVPDLLPSRKDSLVSPSTPNHSMPRTPEEVVRESFILPPTSEYPSAGCYPYSHPFAPLGQLQEDEYEPKRSRPAAMRQGNFYLDPTTLQAAGLILPSPSSAQHRVAPPPSAYTFPASHHPGGAFPGRRGSDAPSQYSLSQYSYSSHSRCPSLVSGTSGPESRPYSFQTHSSGAPSIYGQHPGFGQSKQVGFGSSITASDYTPSEVEVTINLESNTSLVRTATQDTSRDLMSVSSGSTGASSRAMAKLEKKMIAQAEKDARQAESRAKFEALRAEQQKKMAISRAMAQREAEIEAAKPVQPKPQPKSKFGRFGLKLTEAVLFPEGGKNSTMF